MALYHLFLINKLPVK